MIRQIHIPVLIAVMLLSPIYCTVKNYNANKLLNDYTTEGFLDRDHYQVIFKGMPDKQAKGLVAQRETALNNAKKQMESGIIESLGNYNLDYNINRLKIKKKDIQNIDIVKKYLDQEMRQFLEFGFTAFEYYNMNNSAVIVYRIFRNDLIEKVEAVKPDIELKSEKAAAKKAK